MPPEALGVAKFFPADCAFVILGPRVNRLMLAQVKGLSEIFSADRAVVRLLAGMHAVVPTQCLTPGESLATHTAEIRTGETTGSGSGRILPAFRRLTRGVRILFGSWLSGTLWFDISILWVTVHVPLIHPTSEAFIYTRRG